MSVTRPLDIRYASQVATEPITLAEAKAWMQIDFNDWDSVIQNELIPAARIESEKASGMLYVQLLCLNALQLISRLDKTLLAFKSK